MGDGFLRVRAVADEYYVSVAMVCLVLIALGGFLVYGAYAETTERTETTVTNEVVWTSTGQFTHQATVRNDTRVFEAGTALSNRSAYFRQIAPRLNGSFVYNYTADSGNLTTETTLVMRIRSVAGDDSSRREYWRIERPLDRETTTLGPNETLRLTFSENVSEVAQEVDRIQGQLGTTVGTIETAIVASVRQDGTRNGNPVAANSTYSLPLTIESELYRVNDSGPVVEQDQRPVRSATTVVVQAGPLWRYGGPLALFVGLVGLVGLGYGRYSGQIPVTEREYAYLDYRTDRAEFDEWITEARFPADRVEDADSSIETTSLAGLVDLAIDTDRRVIEAADGESYLVLDGDVVYYYDAPTLGETSDPLEPSDAVADPGDPAADVEQKRDDDTTEEADHDGDAESVFERLRQRADLGRDGASQSDESADGNETVESNSDENDADQTADSESDAEET